MYTLKQTNKYMIIHMYRVYTHLSPIAGSAVGHGLTLAPVAEYTHTHTYIYIYIYVYTYIYTHIYIHTHTYQFTYLYGCMPLKTQLRPIIGIAGDHGGYVGSGGEIHKHTHTHIYIHTYVYIYIYIYTYTYTYPYTSI